MTYIPQELTRTTALCSLMVKLLIDLAVGSQNRCSLNRPFYHRVYDRNPFKDHFPSHPAIGVTDGDAEGVGGAPIRVHQLGNIQSRIETDW
jgi:hypothetical protein